MKTFNPQDLSVREVEYAKQFQLNTKQYCSLKGKIWEEAFIESRAELVKKAKVDVRAELREEVRAEMRPALQAEAEKKAMPEAIKKAQDNLRPTMKEEAYREYRKEWAADRPTGDDKVAFLCASREVEIDCLTFAMSASHEADASEKLSKTQEKVKSIGLVTTLVGMGPYTLGLLAMFSFWSGSFALLMLPFLIVLASFGFWTPKVSNTATDLRKMASQYLQLVSRSRMLRLLHIETKPRGEIQDELFRILSDKKQFDEKYRPSLKLMEDIKPDVKLRLSDEMDPEKLFSDEFDDRLKTAEENARGAA